MDISFVIITCDGREQKAVSCIKSILNNNIPDFEIVLVGGNIDVEENSHNIYEVLASGGVEEFKHIKTSPQEETNPSFKRNRGCEVATKSYICPLDEDMILSPYWYQGMKEFSKEFDILTCQIRNPDGTRGWDHASYQCPIKGHSILDPEEESDFLYMSNGGWIMKRNVFDKVKYDEIKYCNQYTMKNLSDYKEGKHNEDTDFSKRCRDNGFKIVHNHDSVVFQDDPRYTSLGRTSNLRQAAPSASWVKAFKHDLDLNSTVQYAVSLMNSGQLPEGLDLIRFLCKKYLGHPHLNKIREDVSAKFGGSPFDERWNENHDGEYLAVKIFSSPSYQRPPRHTQKSVLFLADLGQMRGIVGNNRYNFIECLTSASSLSLPKINLPEDSSPKRIFTEDIHLAYPGDGITERGIDIRSLVELLGFEPNLIIHAENFKHDRLIVENLDSYDCSKALIIEDMHYPEYIFNSFKLGGFDYVFNHCKNDDFSLIQSKLPSDTEYLDYPHFINLDTFKDYNLPKEYDIILYGSTEEAIYPFRKRLFDLILASDLNVKHIPFGGYHGHNPTQGESLAREINKSKIGISTRSKRDCLIKKYLEVPACNTAVAGNIPSEWSDNKELIIELNEAMTSDEIIRKLKYYIKDEKALKDKTELGHKHVTEKCGYDNGIELFNKNISKILFKPRELREGEVESSLASYHESQGDKYSIF